MIEPRRIKPRRIDTQAKVLVKSFLDFLNLDIDSLPRTDFFKLLVDLGTIAQEPRFSTLGSHKSPWADSEELRKEIKEDQRHLKDLLDYILWFGRVTKEIDAYQDELDPDSSLWTASISIVKREKLEKLKKGFADEVAKRKGFLVTKERTSFGERHKGIYELPMNIAVYKGRVCLTVIEKREMLTYAFVDALTPFSLSDIRRCEREDCGRYFLKATKKEKRYCSNKCAWVVASRKRRENNAEKEREKKRLSYERRRKRELGPHVKIQKTTKRRD